MQVKPEPVDDVAETSTAWSVLHDDFMMGARMKDWDKRTSDNNAVDNMPSDRHSGDDDDDAGSSHSSDDDDDDYS